LRFIQTDVVVFSQNLLFSSAASEPWMRQVVAYDYVSGMSSTLHQWQLET